MVKKHHNRAQSFVLSSQDVAEYSTETFLLRWSVAPTLWFIVVCARVKTKNGNKTQNKEIYLAFITICFIDYVPTWTG